MAYDKILVTLDGSKLSELALQHAVRVAAPNAYIHVLSVASEGTVNEVAALSTAMAYHVPAPGEQWPQTTVNRDPHKLGAREKYLEEVVEWLEPAGYRVSSEALVGDVVETIVAVAARGFEVVVMATHGRTGTTKTIVGSIVDAVMQRAPCPVLVIPVRIGQP